LTLKENIKLKIENIEDILKKEDPIVGYSVLTDYKAGELRTLWWVYKQL